MGNIIAEPRRTDAERIRRVETRLALQLQRVRTAITREDRRLTRLYEQLDAVLARKSSKGADLEKRRIAAEIAHINSTQQTMDRCYTHLQNLIRIVRQLKSGRFASETLQSVHDTVRGLNRSFHDHHTNDAPTAQFLADEMEASRAAWEKHLGGLHDADPVHDILAAAQRDLDDRMAQENLDRDRRFRELAARSNHPTKILPAATPVA